VILRVVCFYMVAFEGLLVLCVYGAIGQCTSHNDLTSMTDSSCTVASCSGVVAGWR